MSMDDEMSGLFLMLEFAFASYFLSDGTFEVGKGRLGWRLLRLENIFGGMKIKNRSKEFIKSNSSNPDNFNLCLS